MTTSNIKQVAGLFLSILFGLLLFIPLTAAADDPKAREIMTKVDKRDDGDNAISDMEMILIDKRGNKRIRKIKTFTKDKGEDTQIIMFFLRPADVKNTGFLTYDYDDPERDDDQWLYLPALKKTKRIATSDKSGSFMGSDFAYADMTSRNLEDYDFKLLKETEVKGKKTWLIESISRSKEVIDETGYTKSLLFVRQDNYVVIRAVHFVKQGKKLKYFEIKKLELIDNIWTGTEIQMVTKKGKTTLHKTILKLHNVKYNQNLDESMFTVRRLEKGL
jgi:hypothetical protein